MVMTVKKELEGLEQFRRSLLTATLDVNEKWLLMLQIHVNTQLNTYIPIYVCL